MDQEGQIDYDFGGDPDVYVDVIRSDWCYAYRELVATEDNAVEAQT